MLTPRFRLTQSETTVTIIIRAPYINLAELEISVEKEEFLFFGSPYYLRLHLPGEIVENDCSTSSFDVDSGQFTLTFEKVNPGEHFPDLDLITKLLCPKIEIGEDGERKIVILGESQQFLDEENQDPDKQFGFAMTKKKVQIISSEFKDVFDANPEETGLIERRKLRLQNEQTKFSRDHYFCDYIENEEILEIMALKPPWPTDPITFDNAELDFLKDLPNIEYKLTETQITYCLNSLIDILFAYCYDRRTTTFEGTCESGWTIVKLAASFCWLEVFEDPKQALISGFRRSLIYPLYRHFELSQTVLTDLKQLFKLGETYIIKCLIEMHNIFLTGDCLRYILNNLFIKDYITYIMKWDKTKWQEVVAQVDKIVIKKIDLGLNLAEIENDISGKLNFSNLTIKESDSDDEDSESSSGDSASSSEDSEDD